MRQRNHVACPRCTSTQVIGHVRTFNFWQRLGWTLFILATCGLALILLLLVALMGAFNKNRISKITCLSCGYSDRTKAFRKVVLA